MRMRMLNCLMSLRMILRRRKRCGTGGGGGAWSQATVGRDTDMFLARGDAVITSDASVSGREEWDGDRVGN